MKKIIILATMLLAAFSNVYSQKTDSLDRFINQAIRDGFFPGAQLVVGNKDGIVYSKNYGYMDYSKKAPVTDSTLYDLASCTKVCATTLSVMRLVDEGKLSVETPIGDILEFPDSIQFGEVKVKELLYHNSGFLAGVSVAASLMKSAHEDISLLARRRSETHPYHFDTSYYTAKDIVYDSIYISKTAGVDKVQISRELYLDKSYYPKLDSMVWAAYRPKQRGRHVYSDLNFYLLQQIIETITQTSLDKYAGAIYDQMELTNIGYKPMEWSSLDRICPTECDVMLRRDTVRGFVHDDLACVMDGVCGNAGLFSTASSVAKICGMFLRGGVDYNGERIVESQSVANFSKIVRSPYNSSVYGLGFTKINSTSRPYTADSYGHSGYTGTYMWIDPTKDIYVVILTNRTFPTRTNKNFGPDFRSDMWEVAMSAFGK